MRKQLQVTSSMHEGRSGFYHQWPPDGSSRLRLLSSLLSGFVFLPGCKSSQGNLIIDCMWTARVPRVLKMSLIRQHTASCLHGVFWIGFCSLSVAGIVHHWFAVSMALTKCVVSVFIAVWFWASGQDRFSASGWDHLLGWDLFLPLERAGVMSLAIKFGWSSWDPVGPAARSPKS